MSTDSPTPLATAAQMSEGPYGDLVSGLSTQTLADVMIQATREVETRTDRRLAPFTITESVRAEGVSPDEYGNTGTTVPLDLPGAIGQSYANALSAGDLVRHMWLRHYAPRYQELWGPYTISSMTVVRAVGGTQTIVPTSLQGPEPDSGHVWFQLGTFLPIGSLVRTTYSGGYATIPADLVRLTMMVAAQLVGNELNPAASLPEKLDELIDERLCRWAR